MAVVLLVLCIVCTVCIRVLFVCSDNLHTEYIIAFAQNVVHVAVWIWSCLLLTVSLCLVLGSKTMVCLTLDIPSVW